jgi:hypothetical protein
MFPTHSLRKSGKNGLSRRTQFENTFADGTGAVDANAPVRLVEAVPTALVGGR